MIQSYVQMIVALAVVIGLILFMSRTMKKRQVNGGMMQIVAQQSFGPRKGLVALKMGKEILLLGVTSTDIRLLKTFGENDFDLETAAGINEKLRSLREIKERLHESE